MKLPALIISILLFSVTQQEDEKYLNYIVAARNNSTVQFNLVITFKNLNSNQSTEICLEGEQLVFAICKEKNLNRNIDKDFDEIDRLISENKSRYFEFKNQEAIERLTKYKYSESELKELESKVNFDKLAKQAKSSKYWKKSFDSNQEQIMYAHELFNRGVLTGQNNCMGGQTLYVIDRDNPY